MCDAFPMSCCRNLRDMLEAQLRNPAQRFMARVRQVCYEVMLNTDVPKPSSDMCESSGALTQSLLHKSRPFH